MIQQNILAGGTHYIIPSALYRSLGDLKKKKTATFFPSTSGLNRLLQSSLDYLIEFSLYHLFYEGYFTASSIVPRKEQ